MLKEKLVELAACVSMDSILASLTEEELNKLYSAIITERSRRWDLELASASPSVELDGVELVCLRAGSKVNAIKRYKERNNISLAEAKHFRKELLRHGAGGKGNHRRKVGSNL